MKIVRFKVFVTKRWISIMAVDVKSLKLILLLKNKLIFEPELKPSGIRI